VVFHSYSQCLELSRLLVGRLKQHRVYKLAAVVRFMLHSNLCSSSCMQMFVDCSDGHAALRLMLRA